MVPHDFQLRDRGPEGRRAHGSRRPAAAAVSAAARGCLPGAGVASRNRGMQKAALRIPVT